MRIDIDSFMDRCVAGVGNLDEIDLFVEIWNRGIVKTPLGLHEFLGMTWEEYQEWGIHPSHLPQIVRQRRFMQHMSKKVGHTDLHPGVFDPLNAKSTAKALASIQKDLEEVGRLASLKKAPTSCEAPEESDKGSGGYTGVTSKRWAGLTKRHRS